jgi:hypothetical protein
LLLRHLNSVFKVLAQTVPDTAKNDTLREMELYLGTMIRQVDSSLLDEWEKLRNPSYQRAETKEVRPPGAEEAAADITRDTKAFTAAIRNRIFTFLRGLVIGDYEAALGALVETERRRDGETATREAVAVSPIRRLSDSEGNAWTADRLAKLMDDYLAGHKQLLLTPEARNMRHTYVTPSEDKLTWRVQQVLVDPEGHNDWVAEFRVDLAASREAGEPALRLERVGPLV